jgi:trk system potassium uptake protein TrkH
MRIRIVIQVIGAFLRYFSLAYIAPFGVALFYGETRDAAVFASTGLGSVVAGYALTRGRKTVAEDLRRVEGLAIVAGSWILISWSAAIPYLAAGMGPIDAMFESMSGLTTTGATVIRDFSEPGRGLLSWMPGWASCRRTGPRTAWSASSPSRRT